MIEGDVVVVTGELDARVREKHADGLVYGTVMVLHQGNAWVLMDDGDIWRGPNYEIAKSSEQVIG